jgi:2-amino-4-hydroxy-6-hydroxymethyldihydropteridine diphosphokinase
MPHAVTAICILGSNQGCRTEMLRRAAFLLAASSGVEIESASSIYETPPWGRTEQPAFLNAAVAIRTTLDPLALLDCFQRIEKRLGRRAESERWAPRAIDLDLAVYGEQLIDTPRLTVPHAHLAERAFALVPLLEIAPERRAPDGMPYAEALEALGGEVIAQCRRIGPLVVSAGALCAEDASDSRAMLCICPSPTDTERLAEGFSRDLQGGETLALVGNLGAGKTCFARGLARGLGIEENITSPSYVLVKSYEGRLAFHHADFYRLAADDDKAHASDATNGQSATPRDARELASLGLDDYLDDPDAVVLIEWADQFPDWIEPPFWLIEITGSGDGPRAILLRSFQA